MSSHRTVPRLAAVIAAGLVLYAQAPPPAHTAPQPAGPDDVVATVDGDKLTPRRLNQIRSSLPASFQQAVARMDNRNFVKSYGELLALSKRGEEQKLTEVEPYKSQFAFLRMNFLAQSYLDNIKTRIGVEGEEIDRYYKEHIDDYSEAVVRAIYIAFSPNAGKPSADPKAKKLLTEGQARAKAEALAAQLKKGADFAPAARANSDDLASAEKGGDIGPIKKTASGIPAEIRDVVFALKPGGISDPVRQPAGFYIFQLEKTQVMPYDEAAGTIATTVQAMKVQAEIGKILATIKITYDNEEFFNEPVAPGPLAPRQ